MQTMKTRKLKRKLALFVAVIMVLSLWTAVPLTASADLPAYTLTYSEGGLILGAASDGTDDNFTTSTATTYTINLTSPIGAETERYFKTSTTVQEENWVLAPGGTNATKIKVDDQTYKVSFPENATGTATLTVNGDYVITFTVTNSVVGSNVVKPGETFAADGFEWRVLHKNGDDDVLVIAEHVLDAQQINDISTDWDTDIRWDGSALKTALNNDTYDYSYDSLTTLKDKIIDTTIYTRIGYLGNTYQTLIDQKLFLLSEEEVYLTSPGTPNLANNIYGDVVLFADNNARKAVAVSSVSVPNYWLRSPRRDTENVAMVNLSTGATNYNIATTSRGVRPALCLDLSDPVSTSYLLTVDGGAGSSYYAEGTSVSIAANPASAGQAFKWEVTSGTGGNFFEDKYSATTVLTMPAENITVTATYKDGYALTVEKGTDNLGVGLYAENDMVSITADNPPSGEVFNTWTSDPTGVVFTNPNSSTTTFAMPANEVTVTATYKDAPPPPPATYAVTVENGVAGSASYAAGATVSITANAPADGKVFDTWTSSGITLTDPTSATTSFTMPANAVTVTATYKDDVADVTDTDGDGVPDYVETKDGTDPTDKNSFKDENSDGIPDYVQEHEEPLNEINGWVYANGVWKYYIDSVAKTGWLYDTNDKSWYLLDDGDGHMLVGWQYDKNYKAWFYLTGNGAMKVGWFYDKDYKAWFYLIGDGAMKVGWLYDNNDKAWFYFVGDGAMAANSWTTYKDSWYYLSGNGKMLTGKRSIGGKAYSFKANGAWVS
jgi:hypothetical protein